MYKLWLRLRLLYLKFRWWAAANEPVFCFRCGRLIARKNVRRTIRTTGHVVNLCVVCHRDMFGPFDDSLNYPKPWGLE